VIDEELAWWPPTFVPSGFSRPKLAWCTIHVASQRTRRWMDSRVASSAALLVDIRQKVQHGPVPRLGLIAVAEVARRAEHHELRAADLLPHDLHRSERRVLIAADQERRHAYLAEAIGDVVHGDQRAERVRVADRRERTVVGVKLGFGVRVEREPACDVRVPHLRVAADAVGEDEWEAPAVLLVVDPHPIVGSRVGRRSPRPESLRVARPRAPQLGRAGTPDTLQAGLRLSSLVSGPGP